MKFKSIFVFSLFLTLSCAAKIFILFPFPSYSHVVLGKRLASALGEKGHDVTFYNPYNDPPANNEYTSVYLENIESIFDDAKAKLFEMESMGFLQRMNSMLNFGTMVTEGTLKHPKIQQLLKSNETYDLVIIEQFLNEAHRGFQHHFKAPCIMFSTVGATSWANEIIGNIALPSYIPDVFSAYSGRMTFLQRVANFMMRTIAEPYRNYIFLQAQRKIYQQYFPDAPNLEDLIYDTSLVLLNSHTSTNQPVPLTPNMIEIGGFHVQPSNKLPDHLQKYLDKAKEGVVYFSMGSNLRSADIPAGVRKAILKVLGKLNEKVLWKFEVDLPEKPKNVKIEKWLPQQDILAHPNVKLFISHGGLLSTIEAIYHGVPVIGIPVFGDQKSNMQNSQNNGFALTVPYKQITEETFSKALEEMLTNNKYKENAKSRSGIMHDQPVKPIDKAVFWVEHVIRHKGAKHFRSDALDLTWYQLYSLDVILFGLTILSIIPLLILVLIMKKRCCKSACAEKVSKKKKN